MGLLGIDRDKSNERGETVLRSVSGDAETLEEIRNTLLDGLRLVRVTQAEYDALPTPRPVDVLYVVTN